MKIVRLEDYKKLVRLCFNNKKHIFEMDKLFRECTLEDKEVIDFYALRQNIGLLLFCVDETLYVSKFTKSKISADKDGKIKPVICDLCYTRLPGTQCVRINFVRNSDQHSFSWLVCSNLDCSNNVREKTHISIESKKLLIENIPIKRKIERLKEHIRIVLGVLKLEPIEKIK